MNINIKTVQILIWQLKQKNWNIKTVKILIWQIKQKNLNKRIQIQIVILIIHKVTKQLNQSHFLKIKKILNWKIV